MNPLPFAIFFGILSLMYFASACVSDTNQERKIAVSYFLIFGFLSALLFSFVK